MARQQRIRLILWGRASEQLAMDQFDHILNWTLQPGSHKFPGPDGGTCINEAALVAAGFPYQAVKSVAEMPACFSRPICRLALRLNDEATDKQRQRLLPFVTRLACADTEQVEQKRAAYIHTRTSGRISFDEGLEVLEGALAIGRQADDLNAADVSTRMSTARSRAKRATSIPDMPLAPLLTTWAWVKQKVKVS
jgi:hypothetical protein